MKVWVLTCSEIGDGSVIIAIFTSEPTRDQLTKFVVDPTLREVLIRTGSTYDLRLSHYSWYNLNQYETEDSPYIVC